MPQRRRRSRRVIAGWFIADVSRDDSDSHQAEWNSRLGSVDESKLVGHQQNLRVLLPGVEVISTVARGEKRSGEIDLSWFRLPAEQQTVYQANTLDLGLGSGYIGP